MSPPNPEFSILTPNAMLGYGYKSDEFWYGVTQFKPSAIIVDCGSTDGGPYKLGMGKMTCGRGSYIRDLEPILAACFHYKIKLLIGSVGGDGSNKHVAEFLSIVAEIAQNHGYHFKIATIETAIDPALVKSRVEKGLVTPCGPLDNLTVEAVDSAVDIVAQMGAEPYLEALRSDPDIILGGRSYDPAPFAAFSISKGVSPDTAWHMGKIMECGGICAVPKGRSMIATMRNNSFDLTPLSPAERCTPLSVAAHTLYEKTRPDLLPGPGGVLNLQGAKYEQVTDKTCRVSGAKFMKRPYQVKLEGVTQLGFRTIFIGGIRDPILINQIDDFLERVRIYTQNLFPQLDKSDGCRLIYHVYGKNGVMGPLEPVNDAKPHEIAVLGEVVAPSAELSHTIANNARASILHFSYPDQIATTGNFASPLSPHEQDAGAVFKFSLYHLVDLEPGEDLSLFPIKMHDISSEKSPDAAAIPSQDVFETLSGGKLAPIVKKDVPLGKQMTMAQAARIIRSKNSGPFEMTFDIMFDSFEVYSHVKAANVLTNDTIKSLYHVTDHDILTNMYFDPALAWKCTIRRPWAQGSVGERDTLGTQQHAPLLDIVIPAVVKPVSTTKETNFPHVDRSHFTSRKIVEEVWRGLDLPTEALDSLDVSGHGNATLPSSFKIGMLAQGVIGLTALLAARIYATRNGLNRTPNVHVPLLHATAEFKSERLYTLDGKPPPSPWGPIGGLHKTSDGHVRVHDSFPNHGNGALEMVGLDPQSATRADLAAKLADWASIDVETAATVDGKLAIYSLRSYRQWDALPQSRAINTFPIDLEFLPSIPSELEGSTLPSSTSYYDFMTAPGGHRRPLSGLRVVELSRVIAAPLCGRTLAAYGADVIWVTSPSLPDLPAMDRDFGRGKRTVSLDITSDDDKAKLTELLRTADVLVQGFRPGALAAEPYGLSDERLHEINPNLIVANMSAWGPRGPWSRRRGFDSLVQTASGMNVSEAEHYHHGHLASSPGSEHRGDASVEKSLPARATPAQALDHAAGYMLAAGVMAAVYKRSMKRMMETAPGGEEETKGENGRKGGLWKVYVSLAGQMRYLRSLGQYPGDTSFAVDDFEKPGDLPDEFAETRSTGFGEMRAVKHSATIEGVKVGWDMMPKPLGSDRAEWL